jgi:hypothetical protein
MPIVVWHKINYPGYNPNYWINRVVRAEIYMVNSAKKIYGMKFPLQYPLIPNLYEVLECKFVYLKRDGREVVRSMLNWNQQATGTVYRECQEPEEYHGRAKQRRDWMNSTIYTYYQDMIKPRPRSGKLAKNWLKLSRVEMYAYYWAAVHEEIAMLFREIPPENVFTLDMSSAHRFERAVEMTDWLGLRGAKTLRDLRPDTNSLEDTEFGKSNSYKHWSEWDDETTESFNKYAGKMMLLMGYES